MVQKIPYRNIPQLLLRAREELLCHFRPIINHFGLTEPQWRIIRALSDVLGKRLPFDSLAQLRAKLYGEFPHLARVDRIATGSADDVAKAAKLGGRLGKGAFTSPVTDFYLTNPIARASAVMAECSALARNGFRQAAE